MPTTEEHPPRHRVVHLGHPESHIPLYEIPEIVAPRPTRPAIAIGFSVSVIVAATASWLEHISHGVPDARVTLAWVTPFVLLLASIAVMPFVARHWWEHNYALVSLALGAIVAIYYLWRVPYGPGNLAHVLAEYISFIFLLGSLFVVSGGILIRVRARATPLANTVLLLAGAIVANLFGTTGASMLLIRPFLRMNKGHLRAYHVVFFIFVVANAGGSLTPIGDPPLFLGYLRGVPFFWVFEHCWPIWLVAVGALLAIFFVIDTTANREEQRHRYDGDDLGPAVSFYGGANVLFIVLIIAGILLHAELNHWTLATLGFEGPWRELCMAIAAFASLAITPQRVHVENRFNYAPIREVALLFVGIFATMLPALNYLYHSGQQHRDAGGGTRLLNTPGQYYFVCGGLSSVLDNAPTYLTFLKTELGSLDDDLVSRAVTIVKRPGVQITASDIKGLDGLRQDELRAAVDALVKYHGDRVSTGNLSNDEIRVGFLIGHPLLNRLLIAISMGAVLFGACTYIGNGPNFMVKSIAEHAGAPTPGFFTYIAMYTLPILLPILVVIWLIFLR
jgi:Na+/H+ antiporter NhaD/arsenite permease-like protein